MDILLSTMEACQPPPGIRAIMENPIATVNFLLIRAIMENQVATVNFLLGAGASPPRQNARGSTASAMAVWRRTPKVIRALAEAGADLAGNNVFSPLMLAAQFGQFDSVVEILKHVSLDTINSKGEGGRTALILACKHNRKNTARALFEAGADVTVCGEDGLTALFWAAYWGDGQTMGMLIRAGADPVRQMDWGRRPSPLHVAARRGKPLAVRQLLLAGAQPSAPDHRGRTPLHVAAIGRHSGVLAEIAKLLRFERKERKWVWSIETIRVTLAIRDKEGKTALHYAEETKHTRSAMILLHTGSAKALKKAHGKYTGYRAVGEIIPNELLQPRNPAQEAHMAQILARRRAVRAQSWRWPRGGTFEGRGVRGGNTVVRGLKQAKSRHLALTEAMFR